MGGMGCKECYDNPCTCPDTRASGWNKACRAACELIFEKLEEDAKIGFYTGSERNLLSWVSDQIWALRRDD